MLVTLLTVAVVGSVSNQIVENYVQQREIDSLRENAQAIAKQAHTYLWPLVQHNELRRLVQTAALLGDFRVRIFDNKDRVIIDSGSSEVGSDLMLLVPFIDLETNLLDEGDFPVLLLNRQWGELLKDFKIPSIQGLPPGGSITFLERSYDPWSRGYIIKDWISEGEFHLEVIEGGEDTIRSNTTYEFSIGDQDSPRGYVELSGLPDFGSDVLFQVRQALAFGGGGAVLLAGVVGFWMSHRLASPLKKLAETSAQMETGDLSVRADVKSRGEIGDLAQQFNQMAERLESSFQQLADERDSLRRFITDASHELRTPLTALKNFNTLLMENAGDDPKTRAEFLGESQLQIDRLAWITSNLLDLSRLDAGLLDLEKSDCDLREILETVAGSFESLAKEKDIQIRMVTPDDPCVLACDRARLEMVVSNLIDNAIKFTEDGYIEIGVKVEGDTQVWVRDTGVGIPPEDLPHIFERFYRGRDHAAIGSGLGLAIVKSIVDAHGGMVTAESEVGEGTTIRLSWRIE
jgi:signal transduction histidine kinase